MIEIYVKQCEKAIENGKGEDLPKILQTKVNEQKYETQDKALAKERSPRKAAEISGPRRLVSRTSMLTSTMAAARTIGKEEGDEQKWQKEQKRDAYELFSIELDLDSNSG